MVPQTGNNFSVVSVEKVIVARVTVDLAVPQMACRAAKCGRPLCRCDFMELSWLAGHYLRVSASFSILDRTGVIASIFCAIHCAVAPILLIVAPTLGGIWVHPIAHMVIAALVLPVAAFALRSGFRSHGVSWVMKVGVVGIVLVLLGAALPYFSGSGDSCGTDCDQCCPSYIVDEATGAETLYVPPASIITLMGGICLVVAHAANLRCCARCRD